MSRRVIFLLASVRGAVAVHEPGSVGFGEYSALGGRSLDRIPACDVPGPTVEGGCWRNVFLHPVSKHGPRSLTYVRVQECQTPVRNESNSGRTVRALSAGHNPSGERSECEHTCWDPKDGELCLGRAKPGETLVEARSGSDVQIDRRIWV